MTDLTVVIATFNRPERLRETLRALKPCVGAFDGKCRILVVDNGDTTSAEDVADGASAVYLRSRPGNKSAALNAGIAHAKTEWLAFTDDDTLPEHDWLSKGMDYASKNNVHVVGGRVIAGPVADAMPDWLQPGDNGSVPRGPAVVSYEPMPESGLLDAKAPVPLGSNLFVRKAAIKTHGGYDECLWKRCGAAALGCEDAEWGMRVRGAGEKIGYCAEALVVHPVYPERATLGMHVRWAYRNGLREAILFDAEGLPLHRAVVRAVRGFVKSGVCFVRGENGGAVCELMGAAQALGQYAGRGM